MNLARCSRRDALAILLGSCALATAHGAALPADSVYQLDVSLTDHDGHAFRWPELRGQPLLVSMFYSSCEMVCPLIFETIGLTLAKAGAAGQGMKVLMVSFDPARDTVPVLQKTATAHALDKRWTLARADEAGARKIAALLGVQYRRLTSGEFNHSSTIVLLDGDGRIGARSNVLGRVDPALLQVMQRMRA